MLIRDQVSRTPKDKNDSPMLIRDEVFDVNPYLNRINKNENWKMIHRCLWEIKALMLSVILKKLTGIKREK